MADRKCTLKAFANGVRPASARWWARNKDAIEASFFGIVCLAITALVIYLLACVTRLLVGEGTNTTDFIGYVVFITTICVAIYFTILGIIRAVMVCCEAGENEE